jgi:hypothetical protein
LGHELGELHTPMERSQVGAVIYQLDSVGFHELPVKLAAGQMVAGALGPVRRAGIAAQSTSWLH